MKQDGKQLSSPSQPHRHSHEAGDDGHQLNSQDGQQGCKGDDAKALERAT